MQLGVDVPYKWMLVVHTDKYMKSQRGNFSGLMSLKCSHIRNRGIIPIIQVCKRSISRKQEWQKSLAEF